MNEAARALDIVLGELEQRPMFPREKIVLAQRTKNNLILKLQNLLPSPRDRQTFLKRVLGRPIQLLPDLGRVAVHLSIIPRASAQELYLYLHSPVHLNDTRDNRLTFSCANVVDSNLATSCVFKRLYMCINKICDVDIVSYAALYHTFKPGIIPRAASKQAPDILPCSRNSGLGASPNLPSGSDPITLNKKGPNLKIMTAMSEVFEKSNMISSAIFFALPYGLIGT
nr:hypothetical protein MtrunA17_Chr2g0293531 [Ipomoea batatas]